MNVIKTIWKVFKGLGSFGYLLVGISVIFALAYLFSYPLLVGEFKGNDTPWQMTIVTWINRWWPHLPLWFPLQGGGMNILLGYPIFGHLMTVLVYRLGIADLSLLQVFRVFQFLAVPLAGVSVYLFVWTRFKNQTVALISGVFSLLSAAVWFFLTQFGFYAQTLSFMFFPLGFLFFDGYLEASLNKDSSVRQRRLWLVGAAISFALTTFTHLTTGVVLGACLVAYTFLISFRRGLWSAMKSLFLGISLGLGIIFFWFAGFLRYFALAGKDGSLAFAPDQLTELSLDPLVILGLKAPGLTSMWDNLFFAQVVIVFAVVGMVWGLFRQRKIFYLGLIAIASAFFTTLPRYAPDLVAKYLMMPYSVVYVRALIGTMFLLPIVAGFGAYAIPDLIGLIFKRFLPKDIVAFLLAGMTFTIAFFGFLYLHQPPPNPPDGFPAFGGYSGYGPPHGEGYKGYIQFEKKGELPKITWPDFKIDEPSLASLEIGIKEMDNLIGHGEGKRIDISPYAGGYMQVVNLYTDHSTINAYAYGNSLIHVFWGFQAGAFYSDIYGSPETIVNLAKWFGINSVMLVGRYDPIEKYTEDNWELLSEKMPSNEGIQLRGFKEPRPMAELSSQPLILVVGDFQTKRAYEIIYRLGMDGVFPFDKVWLMNGGSRIDKYSSEDLKKYAGVILYAHQFSDSSIWDRLEKYVKQGGNLYIETGWQYASPDWEMDKAPNVFPVTGTKWGNLGKSRNYSFGKDYVSEVDLTQFGPLIWENQPWGVSLPKGLRSWARPILQAEGKPLVVGGELEKGKVLWSGMNIMGHLRTYEKEVNAPEGQSQEEMKFLKEIVNWWMTNPILPEAGKVEVSRNFPDKVHLSLPQGAGGRLLLWREAFHPDWKARLITEKNGRKNSVSAKILLAGPDWMSVYIPEGVKVTAVELSFGMGFVGLLTLIIMILTWLIIGLILVDAIFKGAILARFRPDKKFTETLKTISAPNLNLGSEEDY